MSESLSYTAKKNTGWQNKQQHFRSLTPVSVSAVRKAALRALKETKELNR